jgi:multidrug efflux pump subunit AcrA (membrane-fusion protein)
MVCVTHMLRANCLVEPGQVVNVGSPVTGLLDEVLVKRADRQQIPLISSIPIWIVP